MGMHPMVPPPPKCPKYWRAENDYHWEQLKRGGMIKDPKYWRAENDYHWEQLKRGGMIVDLAVSSILLLKLVYRLVSLPPRLAIRLWIKYRKQQAAR